MQKLIIMVMLLTAYHVFGVTEATPTKLSSSFIATAYSIRGRTASGTSTRRGIIAADPRVLPLGTKVRVENSSHSGTYTVADTGGGIKGRRIDIWVASKSEALKFGRQEVKLTVLRE